MSNTFGIRKSKFNDLSEIKMLYEVAFPDEYLIPLVEELLNVKHGVLSFVGILENTIVGHISFTLCQIEGAELQVALLAPLAVTPKKQKQGFGTTLVQAGFNYLKMENINNVFVLGDPAYYHRFGFNTEANVAPPYPLPADWTDAWQSVKLSDGKSVPDGKLLVPKVWQQKELWSD